MRLKTDGILLDVDGTLWNSTGVVAQAWTRAVRENGSLDLTVTPKWLQDHFGRRMDVIADDLLPQLPAKRRCEVMKVCCAYEQQALRDDPCRICYPGVPETIRELAEAVPLFIVSNCQAGYIELFLEKTGLGKCIRDFVCFGDNGKGKAENICLLIQKNDLLAPVYVGDTQGDADAASEAGIPFVFADYGFGTASHYYVKITEFAELKTLIEREELA